MPVGVGLLGCGVVGSAVVRGLGQLPAGMRPALRAVAVRDLDAVRDCVLDPGLLTCDARAVMDDPAVHVVVETLGGIDPAPALIARSGVAPMGSRQPRTVAVRGGRRWCGAGHPRTVRAPALR